MSKSNPIDELLQWSRDCRCLACGGYARVPLAPETLVAALRQMADLVDDGHSSPLEMLQSLDMPITVAFRPDECEYCSKRPDRSERPIRKLPTWVPEIPEHGFYVYQLLDTEGTVIYVGQSRKLQNRIKSHIRTQSWGESVDRVIYHECRSLDEMELLEIQMIQTLNPIHNVTHNKEAR